VKNGIINIGTRASKLALWQAEYVAAEIERHHPYYRTKLKKMTTKGDRILDAPLAKIGGKGLFTKELEQAMLAGQIDIAVHSLKDMPTEIPKGLIIGAITKRLDPGDAFVSVNYTSIEELPIGAKVGTSSLRRRAQLLAVRPDLRLLDLRGNVNTRLAKLDADINKTLRQLARLHREEYKLTVRKNMPPDLTVSQADIASPIKLLKNLKKALATNDEKLPFYHDLVMEVIKEDYGPDSAHLQREVLRHLNITQKEDVKINKQENMRPVLITGLRILGTTGNHFDTCLTKLMANQEIVYKSLRKLTEIHRNNKMMLS